MAKENSKQIHHNEAQKLELVQRICDLYETQGATVASCCKAVGINERTFYFWLKENSQLSEIYEKAKEGADVVYWDRLREKAKGSLEKLVDGFKVKGSRKETGETDKGHFSKDIETVDEVGPNPTAVIFTLKGLYPEMFTDRQKIEHSGEVQTIDPAKLTAEQKRQLLEIYEAAK